MRQEGRPAPELTPQASARTLYIVPAYESGPHSGGPHEVLEATPRLELGVGALQAHALPLGHVAEQKGPTEWPAPHKHGADNGARTRDPHLGKVVLYQLSHVRNARSHYT